MYINQSENFVAIVNFLETKHHNSVSQHADMFIKLKRNVGKEIHLGEK